MKMKVVVASLASAFVAGALALTFANRKDADLAKRLAQEQDRWAAEKAQLEAELQSAKRRPSIVTSAPGEPVVVQQQADPEEILAKLKTLRASSRDPRSIRKVIYHLEQLREIGPDALPPIRAFLARFEDVDYMGLRQERAERDGAEQNGNDRERGDRRGPRGDDLRERFREFRDGGRGGDVRLTFTTPPSLRMGLFDVVQGIGGPEAEEILANIMAETGRAVELAYISSLLDEIAPRKYASTAIAAAKDLLLDPPQVAGGNRLDENSKDYLYALLTKLGDTSFAANAQTMLVSGNGEMDRRALSYLDEVMKDQAMPAIYAAYNDPRLTNMMDKASLMNVALKHVGKNQQANELLNSVISNESTPTAARAMAVASLTRGELTPEDVRARIPVVEALRGSTTDERLQRALVATQQNLQNMLEGKPVDNSPLREAFRGGRDAFAGGAGGFGGRRGGQRGAQGATPAPQ